MSASRAIGERLAPQPWMTDAAAAKVLDALEARGGKGSARFVGGCVRNALMDRPVDDIDIATPLTPPEVISALKAAGLKAAPTGVDHGTVTAIADHRPFEVTTLRRDVETDGRRAVVAFTTDWAEDAQRRDFRLNAVYADREGGLYDPTGSGVADALAGRIVFVGDAETRVREDYLRILRFFRFTAWYGRGEPDAEALATCARLKSGLGTLSAERVAKELLKLLAAPDPRPPLKLMDDAGVLAEVAPEARDVARLDRLVELKVAAEADPMLRLAALLPDDPETVRSFAARLRLSNAQRDRLAAAAVVTDLAMSDQAARELAYRFGSQAAADRLVLACASAPGADPAHLERLLSLTASSPLPLPVGGADIVSAGLEPGPLVGRVSKALEAWWIARDFSATDAEVRAELARQVDLVRRP